MGRGEGGTRAVQEFVRWRGGRGARCLGVRRCPGFGKGGEEKLAAQRLVDAAARSAPRRARSALVVGGEAYTHSGAACRRFLVVRTHFFHRLVVGSRQSTQHRKRGRRGYATSAAARLALTPRTADAAPQRTRARRTKARTETPTPEHDPDADPRRRKREARARLERKERHSAAAATEASVGVAREGGGRTRREVAGEAGGVGCCQRRPPAGSLSRRLNSERRALHNRGKQRRS